MGPILTRSVSYFASSKPKLREGAMFCRGFLVYVVQHIIPQKIKKIHHFLLSLLQSISSWRKRIVFLGLSKSFELSC